MKLAQDVRMNSELRPFRERRLYRIPKDASAFDDRSRNIPRGNKPRRKKKVNARAPSRMHNAVRSRARVLALETKSHREFVQTSTKLRRDIESLNEVFLEDVVHPSNMAKSRRKRLGSLLKINRITDVRAMQRRLTELDKQHTQQAVMLQ
eukprot:140977_1